MPEKITIVKESGESVTSNVMSVFMIPETNKQYIITTENAVDPHGLTVLHVSEISGENLVKIATDDEWSSIKTIMRAIISNNIGSYKYIPMINNANAKDIYSRDISVSAGAAKQLLDSYTNGEKEVPADGGEVPAANPDAIESESIFPTAKVETDENAEIAPGLETIPEPVTEAATEINNLEDAIADNQVVDVPIIDNNQIVEPPKEEIDIPVVADANTAPAPVEPVANETPVTEAVPAQESVETPTPSAPATEDASVIPVAIPVLEGEATPVTPSGDVVPVEEPSTETIEAVPTEEVPAEPVASETVETPPIEPIGDVETPNIEPAADVTVPVEPVASETPPIVEPVAAVPETVEPDTETPTEPPAAPIDLTPEIPVASASSEEEKEETIVPVPPVSTTVNANIDPSTIKEALEDVVGNKIENTLSEKVSNILPSVVDDKIKPVIETAVKDNIKPAVESSLPSIVGESIKAPIEQTVEKTLDSLIETKIQAPLMETVTKSVNETIEKQSKALNSLGIKLDFGVESSFGKNASLDEIVAGSQELFVQGVKNLIMVMTERIYKELRIKEDELKRREVIVAQREQAVNDKTIAMMNGTYNPTDYQTPAPMVATPSVVPAVAAAPSVVPETPVAPAPVAPTESAVPVTPAPVPAPAAPAPGDAPAIDITPAVAPAPDAPAVQVAEAVPAPPADPPAVPV